MLEFKRYSPLVVSLISHTIIIIYYYYYYFFFLKKRLSLHMSKVADQAGAYLSFCSMK